MKKILTFGVFDYFHLGHLRLFKQCKEHADFLIVAVQNGEFIHKYKPDAKICYSTQERVELIENLKIVDSVVVYDFICVDFIKNLDFDILALGEDHLGGRFDDAESWCREHGKNVIRLKRTPNICSSGIKESLSLK